MPEFKKVKEELFESFSNKDLLKLSLTHSSASKDNNERLEFLGDAVLSFIISIMVYDKFPDFDEGGLTKIKSKIVSGENLAKVCEKLDLQKDIILSKSEEDNGGRKKLSILAATFEAIMGAFYLDKGINKTTKIVKKIFADDFKTFNDLDKLLLYKNSLQEYLQKLYKSLPEYKVLEESGEPHNKSFLVGVFFQNECLGKGQGKSKKEAETNAAYTALKKINLV